MAMTEDCNTWSQTVAANDGFLQLLMLVFLNFLIRKARGMVMVRISLELSGLC